MTTFTPPPAARPPGIAGPVGRPGSPAPSPTVRPPHLGPASPPPRIGSAGPASPTYAGPTLIGALAVLAGTLAIPPMISGSGWFWSTVEVVMVIWLVGVGARLARVPAVGVLALQVAAVLIALTALFTVGGYAGVIPNSAVLGEAGDLLTGAWTQIRTNVSPAPSSTELSFLICITVSATALIVDMLITLCRAPALVALPLLCVYAVPASIDVSALPWEAFALPAVLYAMLLVADGLAGRRMGPGAGAVEIASGLVVASVGVVIALVVADSVAGIGTAGRLPRTNDVPSTGIGLSPFASLEGDLRRGEPVDLFSVSGLSQPAYLRKAGLQQWTPNVGFSIDQLGDGELPNQPFGEGQTQVTVTPLAYRDDFLPVYNGVTAIGPVDPGWSFDATLEAVHRADPVTPGPYVVSASFAEPSADQLRADTTTAGGELIDTGDLPPEVIARAAEVTAGAATVFDKAEALQRYFTTGNGFRYSLDAPTGTSGDKLLDFLELKQGYCVHYASAMTVMLRALGVPARVAIGFTQGERNAAGDYVITSNDAHAWVEVLFDQAGWVEFDPTPLGGGRGGQQGYVDSTAQTVPSPTTAVTAAPTLGGADGLGQDDIPTAAATSTAGAAAGPAGAGGPTIPSGVWWGLGAIAVLAALIAGPTVVRRRRRERRLAVADAGGPGAAAAAWREVEDLAVDHAIVLDPSQSARACANRLAKAAHLTDEGREKLRVLVSAAEHGWYADADADAVRPVESQTDPRRLGDAPRTVALELAHSVPLGLVERLLPRSVRPRWWRD